MSAKDDRIKQLEYELVRRDATSVLKTVIVSVLNQNVRCSISNNLAENVIRPFVTGRKNWLFADTAKGANASARVYSIVETAKANGLDVLKYLEELLLNMPSWDNTAEYLDEMMPWSDYMQQHCKP